jgi:hypothetical protein
LLAVVPDGCCGWLGIDVAAGGAAALDEPAVVLWLVPAALRG